MTVPIKIMNDSGSTPESNIYERKKCCFCSSVSSIKTEYEYESECIILNNNKRITKHFSNNHLFEARRFWFIFMELMFHDILVLV